MADAVFGALRATEPADFDDISDQMCDEIVDDEGSAFREDRKPVDWHATDGMSDDERRKYFDDINEKVTKRARLQAAEFVSQNPKAVFHIVEFRDNDGPLPTAMEHGNLFKRIPHVKVSHH